MCNMFLYECAQVQVQMHHIHAVHVHNSYTYYSTYVTHEDMVSTVKLYLLTWTGYIRNQQLFSFPNFSDRFH